MMLLAMGICGLFVNPAGSNREWLNLATSELSGTPYCKASDTHVPNESMRPPTVLPSLAMVINSSPGWPSSYNPTVR
ncbi:MAG: hypothetical protein BWY71_01712 [Planctomycetes bacterium ADurb.Bin412]|nr:MAG: hypothetical protein BWY71_01712 [Planctomycetes bacterium ADurb.Bin412]